MTSNFGKTIFEVGKGGMRDEQGANLMEVNKMIVQVKTLVTTDQYLHYQPNVETEMADGWSQNEEQPTMDITTKKKKSYTVYLNYERIIFITICWPRLSKKSHQ